MRRVACDLCDGRCEFGRYQHATGAADVDEYGQETEERALYVKLDDEARAKIGKYASESGDTVAASLSKGLNFHPKRKG